MYYYDLWHGTALTPAMADGKAILSFDLEGLGYGAVLATEEKPDASVQNLLSYMAERSKRPLASYSREWKAVPQSIVEIPATTKSQSPPDGMIRIPEGDYEFQVSGIEIEGGNDPGADVQYPWEDTARRFHRHRMHVHSFYIDRTPVTNAEFARFLDATHYHPNDDHNFLRAWKNGSYPEGWENKPVTWVSIEDARAYADWSGNAFRMNGNGNMRRSPPDRAYPWGNDWNAQALPPVVPGPGLRPPADVTAFPEGASPFGVLDLIGNVSQWTDEYRDPHTRAAIIRGGASYQPRGSSGTSRKLTGSMNTRSIC